MPELERVTVKYNIATDEMAVKMSYKPEVDIMTREEWETFRRRLKEEEVPVYGPDDKRVEL